MKEIVKYFLIKLAICIVVRAIVNIFVEPAIDELKNLIYKKKENDLYKRYYEDEHCVPHGKFA